MNSFPKDYRKEAIGHLLGKITHGISVQVVGLPGSGKSILVKVLNSPETIKYHLGGKADLLGILNVDLNLSCDTNSCLRIILSELGGGKGDNEGDDETLLSRIQELIKELIEKEGRRIVIVFDSFDIVFENPSGYRSLFRFLEGLQNKYKNNLSFIFLVQKEISGSDTLQPFGGFAKRVVEHIYYLPLYNYQDSKAFIKLLEDNLDIKIPPVVWEKIIKFSGGHASTMKRLVCAYAFDNNLDEVIESPLINKRLKHLMEQIQKCLPKDAQQNLIYKRFLELGNPIKRKSTDNLTRSEHLAFELLLKKKGEIVEREELITAIWGEHASLGVADHALDQLIHRLKEKLTAIEGGYRLDTIRGRGHRLSY